MSRTKYVYHFRPDKGPRDINTIAARQLYSARADALNDPFEFAALKALKDYPAKQSEFRNAGVTCFCRSISNPLLWSHYANSHKGFAIGFDSSHTFFGGDKGDGLRFLHHVRYEDIPPSLDHYTIDELAMAAVTTKPTCWSYEQEVRMIKQEGGIAFDIPHDTIKEVLFGAEMKVSRIREIMELLIEKGFNTDFLWMRYLKEGYGVKPESITIASLPLS